MRDNTVDAFFALVRAGLWSDGNPEIRIDGTTDWQEVYRLATEQSVLGLVLSGLEQYKNLNANLNLNQMLLLQWIGEVQMIEQQNKDMNVFLANLVEKMRSAGIYTLLVKGQGVAQCYENPLWRSCGDIDLFLSDDNYEKAKTFLAPLATSIDREGEHEKHLGMTIDSWVVELHGRLYCGLSSRIEKELDDIYRDTFFGGSVRSWNNDNVYVFLLSVENDAFYVFTHILQHFYKGGIGLRQICDWCRLLWTYRESLNPELLESRIRRAGIMSEWKAFGAFAVEYLGMPADAVPLLDVRSLKEDVRWRKKADRICDFIMKVGNMGHNRNSSYYVKYPYVIRKVFSFSRRLGDLYRHARIFPLDSFRFLPSIVFNGVRSAINGE